MSYAPRSRASLALVLVSLTLPLPAAAAEAPRDLDDAVARFREFAAKEMAIDGMPGMSIGYMLGDHVWSEGFGYQDLENRVPATSETMYRLASVSKPMTAMGVLRLVDQGKIDLDADIRPYVPYFPEKPWTITTRQLLGHLGGISHYRNYDLEGHFTDPKDTREAIAVFADFDLVAEPGTTFRYSSYGYNLLGAVIEGVSGSSYGDFMRDEVWGPMEMPSIRMDDPYALIPHRARGYQDGPDGEILNSEFIDISSRFGAGGTRASVIDLLRFARGLADRAVLEPETYDLMWTSMKTREGLSTEYGMGWSINPVNGRFGVSHSGGQAETRTYFAFLPRDDFAIAIACNYEGANWEPYVDQLYRLVMGEPWSPRPYLADADDQRLHRFVNMAFDWGIGYRDQTGHPVTTDVDVVAEAIAVFDALARGEDPGVDEQFRLGGEGNPAIILGSYMVDALADARGPAWEATVHGRGAAAFFADHVALSRDGGVPDALAFSDDLGDRVTRWATDWERVWTDEMRTYRLAHQADLDVSVDELRAAFEGSSIVPDLSGQLTDLSESRFTAGDLAGARRMAEAAIALYPRNTLARVHCGILDLIEGNPAAARERFRQASEIDDRGSAGPGGLNGFAYRLRGIGQTELGLQILTIAIELYPDDANLHDSAGEFHLALGDREQAIELYRNATEVDPEYAHARQMLEELGVVP